MGTVDVRGAERIRVVARNLGGSEIRLTLTVIEAGRSVGDLDTFAVPASLGGVAQALIPRHASTKCPAASCKSQPSATAMPASM